MSNSTNKKMALAAVSSLSSTQAREFKKTVKALASKRARHTELISVYAPAGYELAKIINQLKTEQGTASNIKSSSTRKNVTTALERMIQHLRLFGNRLPEYGIAIFSGNVSEREGFDDFKVWAIIPPKPLRTKVYLCEQKFFLEPLEEMLESHDVYGLLVIERGGATVGILRGKHLEVVKEFRSMIPGKFRAGGQSAARMARVIEGMASDFYKRVGETISTIFVNTPHLKGIIIGGAGPTKDTFVSGDYFHYTLKDKVLGVKDIGTDGEAGLQELVNRSTDILAQAAVTHEKDVVTKFLEALATDGPVTYGEEEVRKAVELNAVETLLVSEALEKVRVELECASCHHKDSRTIGNIEKFRSDVKNMKCPKCHSPTFNMKSEPKDLIEELAETAEELGATVEFISTETSEGTQLFRLGGLAAMLRYKIS